MNGRDHARTVTGGLFTMRQWWGGWNRRRLRLHLAGLAVAVVVLAYLGPFGTSARFSPAELFAYWAGCVLVNYGLAMAVVPRTVRRLQRRGKPVWAGIIIGALAAAVPGSAFIALLDGGIYRMVMEPVEAGLLYSRVFLIVLVLSFLVYRLIEKPLTEGAVDLPPEDTAEAAFLSRLPPHLGRDLLHLHMQDHYVQVHTSKGSELVLLRFSDALREVDGLDGMQVHRSHWVRTKAVARATRRRNGRIFLKLVNGAEVPVSRSFAPALRERGWV